MKLLKSIYCIEGDRMVNLSGLDKTTSRYKDNEKTDPHL